MSDVEWAIGQCILNQFTVCFRTRTISNPGLTNFWRWEAGTSFVKAVQRAVRELEESEKL